MMSHSGNRSLNNRRQDAARRCSGYTLVELLVVLSVLFVIFTSVAVTLHTLRKLNLQVQSDLMNSANLERLSLILRDDAHVARLCSIEQATSGAAVIARFPRANESLVTYETEPTRIVRQYQQGNQPVQQQVFRLAHGNSVHWSTTKDPTPTVTLRIEQPASFATSVSEATRVYQVTATVGLLVGAK
jgi:prepilin-type N-terminal cleavage/methylation domain-containing protein